MAGKLMISGSGYWYIYNTRVGRAMKHPRMTVFAGAITSLSLMHVMASFFGYATTIIPRGEPRPGNQTLVIKCSLSDGHADANMSPRMLYSL